MPNATRDRRPAHPRAIGTTVLHAARAIVVLRADRKSDRYALHRFPDGTIAWRLDTFAEPDDPREASRWIAYEGELPLAEVVRRVPAQRRVILRWTRDEVAVARGELDAADLSRRERRLRSVERLEWGLAALDG